MPWADPRSSPSHPFQGTRPALAATHAEVEPLIAHCEAGSMYAVECWIQEGRPLQAVSDPQRRRYGPTALTCAMGR
jgi:hypothetical protein